MGATALAVAVSGCGSGHVDQLPDGKAASGQKVHAKESPTGTPAPSNTTGSSGSPTPTTGTTDNAAVAKAKQQALAAYRGYWKARVAAMAKPDPDDTSIDRYTIDDAVGDLGATLTQMHKQSLISKGAPATHPHVLSVEVNSPPQHPSRVTISDCLNVKNIKVKSTKTGKYLNPEDKLTQYKARAEVRSVGTDWRVSQMSFHLDEPC